MGSIVAPGVEPEEGDRRGGLLGWVRQLLGGATWLSVTRVLQQGIGFFLLPVYTRYLTPTDYGLIEVLMVSVFLALMVIGQGMPPALLRQLTYVHSDDGRRRRVAAGVAFAHVGLSSLVFLGFASVLSGPLSTALFASREHAVLVVVGAAIVSLQAIGALANAVLLSQDRIPALVGVGLAQFGVKLALNILFVVVLETGFAGVIWSHLIGEAVGVLVFVPLVWRDVEWALEGGELRSLLRYGVPLIASSLSLQVLMVSDRYVIRWLRPGADLGLYAVANKFATAFVFIAIDPLERMWEMRGLELAREGNGPAWIARVANLYLALGGLASLVAIGLAEPLVRVATTPAFTAAHGAVGVLIAGAVLFGLGEVFKLPMRVDGASARISLVAGVAAVFNLGITVLMVPRLGFLGAAIATVVSFALFAGLNAWGARRHMSVPYDWGRLALMAGLLLLACAAQPAMLQLGSWHRLLISAGAALGWVMLMPVFLDRETRDEVATRVRELTRRPLWRPGWRSGNA